MKQLTPGTKCIFRASSGSPGSRVMKHTGETVVIEKLFTLSSSADYVVKCIAHGVTLYPREGELFEADKVLREIGSES